MGIVKGLSVVGGALVIAGVAAIAILPRLEHLGLTGGGGDGAAPTHAAADGDYSGPASIGGPFTLVNGDGKTVTEESWPGQYLLIYFGYTYCPDVCPTSLSTMTAALEQLDPALVEKVQPIFVSVDPERDRPADVAEYASFFHPRMVGLTGSLEQVEAAARAYKVYYAKVEQPESAIGYLLDHSAITYLMAPDGTLAAFFRHGEDPAAMADRLRETLSGGAAS
ncbi:SCO family protein [Roseospira navarrensis]|uniref:Redoxin domain-containing protein n=1 Tax=Roseospira navarrensis TaxID=140058 RepID=A0A7X2D4E3_9PROT|nr:SCO family protein [Roseospira navarrensis]MQX36115.1 redoxin domain-containing protein [Roseospira navarrensis]